MQRGRGLGFGGSGLCRSALPQQGSKTFPCLQLFSQQAQLLGQFSSLLECGSRRLGLAGQRQNVRKCKLRMDDDRAETARGCLSQSQHGQIFRRRRVGIRSFGECADQRRPAKQALRDLPIAVSESRSLLEQPPRSAWRPVST